MSLMAFMEAMSNSNIPLIAAFFIGLMTAFSPCPLATNITAIAYSSKKIGEGKQTIKVGWFYTLGRAITYVLIASLIVYIGVNTKAINLSLQLYGDKMLGPLLLIIGLVMIGLIKFKRLSGGNYFNKLKQKLSSKGLLGSFLLGVLFAMAFCPFSAVLYFGMLIPLALSTNDGIIIPSIFAFGTGLPVIILSYILNQSVSKLSRVMNKIQIIDKWTRRLVGATFIIVGLFYTINYTIGIGL